MRAAYEFVMSAPQPPSGQRVVDAVRLRFSVTDPQVRTALRKLGDLGWLAKDSSGVYRIQQLELLPAHLFLRVAERNWPQVSKFIGELGHGVEQRRVDAVQMDCDLLVSLRVFDRDSLFLLCEEARRSGADDASAVLEKTAGRMSQVA